MIYINISCPYALHKTGDEDEGGFGVIRWSMETEGSEHLVGFFSITGPHVSIRRVISYAQVSNK